MLVKSSEKPAALTSIKTAQPALEQGAPSSQVNEATQKAAKAPEQGQVAVLSRWAQRGKLSQALAQAEHKQATIKQIYTGLERLAKQLKSTSTSEAIPTLQQRQITQQISQLQTLAKGSGLTPQLKLAQPNSDISRQLNANVDLLSPRPHDQHVHLLLGRSGKAVQLQLPANNSEAENLNTVTDAFAKHNIRVEVNRDNRLLFTTKPEQSALLYEPWVISGQGVRIAAGNPISLPLTELDNPLDQLADSVQKRQNISAHLDFIQQAQRQLKASLLQIQSHHKELAEQLQQIEHSAALPAQHDMVALSQSVKSQLTAPSVENIAVIMAQANMTRSMVKYSLT